MAKKIRFPLKMKNGAEVRTLDELKENFDLESVLGYFTDGKLATWLADRYYDEKAEAVSALSADTPELNAKLCDILEVEYQGGDDEVDLEYIQHRNEKLRILSAFTDNKEILSNIDNVAMEQDELFEILDSSPEIIYLYGDKFSIPFGAKNVFYIGINEPKVLLENKKTYCDYDEANILFKNVIFDSSIIPLISKGEKLFLSGNFKEAFPFIKKSAENGNPRAMFILSLYYEHGFETTIISELQRKNWLEKLFKYKNPIASFNYYINCDNCSDDLKKQLVDELGKLTATEDILAQYMLGHCYLDGMGVEENITKGIELITNSAEYNYVIAQYELAEYYFYGYYDLEEDNDKAMMWYKKSANQGLAAAQNSLGYHYYSGYRIEKNLSESLKWYKMAAEQGYAESQYQLGELYYNGEDLSKDYDNAFYWYTKAAEHGYSPAFFELGKMYTNGYGVRQDEEEADKCFKKYTTSSYSMEKVAELFEKGEDVPLNYKKALEWYTKAVDQEEPDCDVLISIGRIYDSIYNDYSKAHEWYQKAFEIDLSIASTIGDLYNEGDRVNSDYNKAVYWYRRGMEAGDPHAMASLGDAYREGKGVTKDKSKALELYEKASEQHKKISEMKKNATKNDGTLSDAIGQLCNVLDDFLLTRIEASKTLILLDELKEQGITELYCGSEDVE